MKKEIFKTITRFKDYSISTHGNLMSSHSYRLVKNRVLKPILQQDGYIHFTLCKDGKKYQMVAHVLVANTFIPNPENKPYVNHRNGIKDDNRVENLEWCTSSENTKHAFNIGLMKSPRYYLGKNGKLHPNSKKLKVILHDGRYVGTYYGTAEASRKLKIPQASISRYCLKQRRHVKYKFYYL